MSGVSGDVYSTVSAAIDCVTVLLEDNPKSETFFQRFKAEVALPSESFGNDDSTYFNYSESSRCTDSYILQTPSLSGSATLGTFRLRVFEGCRLFVLSDFESLGVQTLRTFRLRIFES